jgi:hypothetical protein
MSIEKLQTRQIARPLAHRAGEKADAARIAEETVAIWREIDEALTPIIGKRGVAALSKRSLHLTSAVHPWLAASQEGSQTPTDHAALKSALAKQSSVEAAAGSSAFLNTFYDLLSNLIGPSLTERLLRSVWGPHSSGPPAQDNSP